MLLSEGMNIRVLLFPDGDDPDSFARKHPQEYVENYIKTEANDFINFKSEILLKEAGSDSIKKAEAIRDIVKSVAFVSNALKQEVYLKEISTKFGLSEQSLFNELGVQKQVTRHTYKTEAPKPQSKLELVEETALTVNPLLVLEEKLVELMLKYGDQILARKNEEGETYEITVIEEIMAHLDEDGYEILSPVNVKIVKEISEGIAQNELRSGKFFFSLMDEELTGTVANALFEKYENSDWGKHNIFFSREDEVVPKLVKDVMIRHKREYVVKMITEIKNSLQDDTDNTDNYMKIVKLNELRKEMDAEVYRIL
jgi:DNA primase